jgi:lambda family phage portal protein
LEKERKSNPIDSIIAFISPERAYKREAWRQQLDLMRGYDAAGKGRSNSMWPAANEPAEFTDAPARSIIRARARDLERNSDIANSIAHAFKRNVIGYGFKLRPQTPDDTLNDLIEKEWNEWTKKFNCDVTGQQSFTAMMRMAVQRKKIDGGILFLKCYSGKNKIPLQLQALEVDELCDYWQAPKHKGNKVIDGIELTEFNRPVGYWIKKYNLDGFQLNEPIYYKSDRIIFLWEKKRPSQIREISDFSQSINRIRDANEFITAVSVKERIAACLAVFVKRQAGISPGMGRNPGVPSANEKRLEYSGKMLAPGMIQELNPGDEIQVVDPKGSYGEANGMLGIEQRLISAGHGLSYEAVSRDMTGVNYSSARQSIIEDDLAFAEDAELIEEVMTEVYEAFIISGILAGVFRMPGFFENHSKKIDYLKHEWITSPKSWIDPVKEVNATKLAMESGQKTFAEICAENGRDWKKVIDEMALINEYAASKGVQIGGVLDAPKSPEKEPSESDNGNDDEGKQDGTLDEGSKPQTEDEGGTGKE